MFCFFMKLISLSQLSFDLQVGGGCNGLEDTIRPDSKRAVMSSEEDDIEVDDDEENEEEASNEDSEEEEEDDDEDEGSDEIDLSDSEAEENFRRRQAC